jgi:hypothetical protein
MIIYWLCSIHPIRPHTANLSLVQQSFHKFLYFHKKMKYHLRMFWKEKKMAHGKDHLKNLHKKIFSKSTIEIFAVCESYLKSAHL